MLTLSNRELSVSLNLLASIIYYPTYRLLTTFRFFVKDHVFKSASGHFAIKQLVKLDEKRSKKGM